MSNARGTLKGEKQGDGSEKTRTRRSGPRSRKKKYWHPLLIVGLRTKAVEKSSNPRDGAIAGVFPGQEKGADHEAGSGVETIRQSIKNKGGKTLQELKGTQQGNCDRLGSKKNDRGDGLLFFGEVSWEKGRKEVASNEKDAGIGG